MTDEEKLKAIAEIAERWVTPHQQSFYDRIKALQADMVEIWRIAKPTVEETH